MPMGRRGSNECRYIPEYDGSRKCATRPPWTARFCRIDAETTNPDRFAGKSPLGMVRRQYGSAIGKAFRSAPAQSRAPHLPELRALGNARSQGSVRACRTRVPAPPRALSVDFGRLERRRRSAFRRRGAQQIVMPMNPTRQPPTQPERPAGGSNRLRGRPFPVTVRSDGPGL